MWMKHFLLSQCREVTAVRSSAWGPLGRGSPAANAGSERSVTCLTGAWACLEAALAAS